MAVHRLHPISTMSSIEIVATPGSGNGHAVAAARRTLSLLADRGHRGHLRCFASAAELREWGRQCAPTFSHLVCVGGDTTQSAAAEAAIRLGARLVPVPSGFGNVFARTFGYDGRPESVVDLIERGAVCWVDVGRARHEIFLCHRSYGFLEDVQYAVERRRALPRTRLRRHLAYYAMALEILRDIPLSSIRVDVDGQPVAEQGVVVAVANVETYRGFLTLTPGASPFDGLLDVCILPRVSKRRLFAHLFALFLKLPGRWRDVQRRRGAHVSVSVNGRAWDELQVSPGALHLVVPARRLATLPPQETLVQDNRGLVVHAA